MRSRWITGAGAALSVAGIGFAILDPADFLGWVILLGAVLLGVGIAKRA